MDDEKIVASLIDRPITPYSSAEKISDWLSELEKMTSTPQVEEEIQYGRVLLKEIIEST